MSRVDHFYRRLLLSKFFTKGWGKPDNLKRIFDFRKIMADCEICEQVVPSDYPIHIDAEYPDGDIRILEGHFKSPFTVHLPGIMPKEVETATFQMILPRQWKGKHKPVCIHLAGTGDHFYWRRRLLMAKPLLKEYGIASIILENPYYGTRKPKGQMRSSLHNVSDLFVMGGALMMESVALLHWCKKQGYGPLGLTGISMGGHMASLAATNWREPVSLVPCLSWSTASVAFTQGVLSGAIPWKTLETQFFENSVYQDEISKLIVSPENYFKDQAYMMGQQFVKDFSSNYDKLQKMHFFNSSTSSPSENHPPTPTNTIPHPESASSSVMQEDSRENLQPADAETTTTTTTPATNVAMMQAFVGSISYPGNTSLPSQSSSQASTPSATSKSPLTLQHALSKSKLSRTAGVALSDRSPPLKFPTPFGGQSSLSAERKDGPAASMSRSLKKEAVNFMIGVMDECTHLANFPTPVDPRLIIIVAAQDDAYIPRQGVMPLNKLWPGSEVRYLANTGHIAAFVFHNSFFRKAIADSFERQKQLYYQS